jgi:hypothetical protein
VADDHDADARSISTHSIDALEAGAFTAPAFFMRSCWHELQRNASLAPKFRHIEEYAVRAAMRRMFERCVARSARDNKEPSPFDSEENFAKSINL